jgi:hypothetical protein
MQNCFKVLLITPFALIFAYFVGRGTLLRLQLRRLEGDPVPLPQMRINPCDSHPFMRIIRPSDRQAGQRISGWKIKRLARVAALRLGLHTPVAKA